MNHPTHIADGIAGRELLIAVPGRTLVRDLTIDCPPGRVLAVLGRNGAGKSSTLLTLAGHRTPASGTVLVHGRPINGWPRRELARELGLLAQSSEDPFPATVLETVLVGRHPHVGLWEWESALDLDIARRCLAEFELQGFEQRDVTTLSGGERRRLALATVLAQEPRVLLLDEPIQQLDPRYQVAVLQRLQRLARSGCTVVMSLHDAGLAARFADEALLLHGEGDWSCGPCEHVLNEESVSTLYGLGVREIRWPGGRSFVAA
jgi:iron complex transport system ATP-binding protein